MMTSHRSGGPQTWIRIWHAIRSQSLTVGRIANSARACSCSRALSAAGLDTGVQSMEDWTPLLLLVRTRSRERRYLQEPLAAVTIREMEGWRLLVLRE